MRGQLWAVILVLLLVVAAWAGDDKPSSTTPRPELAEAKSVILRTFEIKNMDGIPVGAESWSLARRKGGEVILQLDKYVRVEGSKESENPFLDSSWHLREYYGVEGDLGRVQGRVISGSDTTTFDVRIVGKYAEVVSSEVESGLMRRLMLPNDHATDFQTFEALLKSYSGAQQEPRDYRAIDLSSPGFIQQRQMSILARKRTQRNGAEMDVYVLRMRAGDVLRRRVVDKNFMPIVEAAKGLYSISQADGAFVEYHPAWWMARDSFPVAGVVPWGGDLESLELTVTVVDTGQPSLTFGSNRYQRATERDGCYELQLHSTGVGKGFKPPPLPIESSAELVKQYSAPTTGIESKHPKIEARARRIVGDAANGLEATQRIVSAVFRMLAKRSDSGRPESALRALEEGVGDCSGHAALVVAMCRALGIPARRVAGIEYVVGRDGRPFARPHIWAEVWLGRWVGVDPTLPEVGTGARYILLAAEKPGEQEDWLSAADLRKRKLRFQLRAYRQAECKRIVLGR